MIMLSDTISDPEAVVVVSLDAGLALSAVFCPVLAKVLTFWAEVAGRFVREGVKCWA